MKTWYRTHRKIWIGKRDTAETIVEPVEVERSTAANVWINGRRCNKRTTYENYFETFEEARDFVLGNMRASLEAKENAASSAYQELSKACEIFDQDVEEQETAPDPWEDQFYLLSSRLALFPHGCALLWAPDNSGYVTDMARAGIYTKEQILGNRSYYDNNECRPIPVKEALAHGHHVIERSHAEVLAEAVNLG